MADTPVPLPGLEPTSEKQEALEAVDSINEASAALHDNPCTWNDCDICNALDLIRKIPDAHPAPLPYKAQTNHLLPLEECPICRREAQEHESFEKRIPDAPEPLPSEYDLAGLIVKDLGVETTAGAVAIWIRRQPWACLNLPEPLPEEVGKCIDWITEVLDYGPDGEMKLDARERLARRVLASEKAAVERLTAALENEQIEVTRLARMVGALQARNDHLTADGEQVAHYANVTEAELHLELKGCYDNIAQLEADLAAREKAVEEAAKLARVAAEHLLDSHSLDAFAKQTCTHEYAPYECWNALKVAISAIVAAAKGGKT